MAYHGLSSELAEMADKTLSERIDHWSGMFLGTPYAIDPLGEGNGPDPDPLFDPCHVDCETMVEQTLALSFSRTPAEVMNWMRVMRYHGCEVTQSHRFFTMAGSWIPGNIALGYLKPIKGLKTRRMRRFVRPEGRWRNPFKSRLTAMGRLAPRGWQHIDYVPIDWIHDQRGLLAQHTPALAMVVAARQLGNPFMVTHMGLLLRDGNGRLFFRHASSLHHRVMDVPLEHYVRFLKTYEKEGFRPVAGLAFLQIVSPPSPPSCP